MSGRGRTVVSIFVGCHLAAITVAAIPFPKRLAAVAGTSRPADDGVSAAMRPILDRAAALEGALDRFAAAAVRPLRPVADAYITPLGLEQSWNMFANPPLTSEYLRLRYYVRDSGASPGGPTVFSEVVFPAASASQGRMVTSFRDGHQDKAVSNAIYAYLQERNRRRLAGDTRPLAAADETNTRTLRPLAQFFADRFQERRAAAGRPVDVVRVEAWYGTAPSRPPGEDSPFVLSHAAALARYRSVPVGPQTRPWPRLDAVERESDIMWILIFAGPA